MCVRITTYEHVRVFACRCVQLMHTHTHILTLSIIHTMHTQTTPHSLTTRTLHTHCTHKLHYTTFPGVFQQAWALWDAVGRGDVVVVNTVFKQALASFPPHTHTDAVPFHSAALVGSVCGVGSVLCVVCVVWVVCCV
jgi:hypothetical protein